MERWVEDIRMAIDLAEQSSSPNVELLSTSPPDTSKMLPVDQQSNWSQHPSRRRVFVLQSLWRTLELSWSRKRSSAARARPSSVRVTVATPPFTSAGIATPACPWWTSASPWRCCSALRTHLCFILCGFLLSLSSLYPPVLFHSICAFICLSAHAGIGRAGQ